MSELGRSRLVLPDLLGVHTFAESRIQDLELLDAAVAAATARRGYAAAAAAAAATEAAASETTSTEQREQQKSQDGATTASVAGKPPTDQSGGLQDQAPVLARHMRRRTTSHKPRRMPTALKNSNREARARAGMGEKITPSQRGDNGVELPSASKDGGEDKARCRKHRRRPRAMLAARSPHAEGLPGERSPARWLETHIWHAKRMHMKEMWGFKIPFKSNRGHRATVQAALEHCTVQDVTFLRPLEMRGPLGCLLGVLGTMTDPLDDRFARPDCVNGFVEASTHLYRMNEFPLGCIAPVTVMWSPANPTNLPLDEAADEKNEMNYDADGDAFRRAWLWVHPAAVKEALLEMRKACVLEGATWAGAVEVGTVEGGLCRLRVRGSKAHDTVRRVLKPRATTDRDNKHLAAAAAAAATPAAGEAVGFGDAARENADFWRALERSCCLFPLSRGGQGSSSNGSGSGCRCASNPRARLLAGSVLAISVLDPRDRVPPRGKFCAPEGISSAAAAPAAEETSKATVTSSKATGASIVWPPRWAVVSPLWDPEARKLSSLLADSRPDHLLNEARHRERVKDSWEHMTLSTPTSTTSSGHEGDAPPDSSFPSAVFSDGGCGRGEGLEVSPVLLVSSFATSVASGGKIEGFPRGRSDNKEGKKYKQRGTRLVVEAGWDLILPAGWAGVFFRALVMAGARAISVEDADSLAFEAETPSFPADFPDTTAGRRHWDEIGRESLSAWARTRPKHRGFKAKDRVPFPTSLPTQQKTHALDQKQQQQQESNSNLSRLSLRQFRPDFCSLAAGFASDVTPNVEVAGDVGVDDVEGLSGVGERSGAGTGISIGTGDTPPKEGGEEGDGIDPLSGVPSPPPPASSVNDGQRADGNESAGAERVVEGRRERESFAVARGFSYVQAFLPGDGIEEDGDDEQMLQLRRLLLPLQLAFPTMLEVLLRQYKGVPKEGALIHPASPQHHTLWLEGERAGTPWPGFGVSHQKPSVHGAPERASPAIGAVTSGGFSILRGGAIGRGYCEAGAVRDAIFSSIGHHKHFSDDVSGERTTADGLRPPQGWALVLVGNDAESWLRPAIIEVVV